MSWQEVTLRLALIVGLLGAVMSRQAVWIAAPLGLVTMGATAELAVRPYGSSAADRLLLGCGAVVTALILIGLGLNLTPWGLTRVTWTAAWLTVSLCVIVWRRHLTVVGRGGLRLPVGRAAIAPLVWVIAVAVILSGAGALGLAGVQRSAQQRLLAFALESKTLNSAVVAIEASSLKGKYEITAVSDVRGARPFSSNVVAISAGSDGKRVLERVLMNTPGIWTINLESANDGAVVRFLRVDIG